MKLYGKTRPKAKDFVGRFEVSGAGVMRAGRSALLASAGMLLLSACATTGQTSRPPQPHTPPPQTGQTLPEQPGAQGPETPGPQTPPQETADKGLHPAFMQGDVKRIALILPLSSRSPALRREARSMLKAAQMAVFDEKDDHLLLIPLDSQGTPDGAKAAAEQALSDGADVVLGPITAPSVKQAGLVTAKAHIPLIGFSTDTKAAGNGVFLLSFPPEAEVARITEFAARSGASKFAFLGPDSRYGRRVLGAYRQSVQNLGGDMTAIETYHGKDISVMQEPAAKLAAMFPDTEDISKDPNYEDPYHVVLMPEGGTALRSLAPLLTFYNENTRHVQLMGTSLWGREDVAKEPALNGGIFAGPETEGKEKFAARYEALYGQAPSRLASEAYDGILISGFTITGDPDTEIERLIDPAGFYGVDGFVRFGPDGKPKRGLAVYQIKNGHVIVIDQAPKAGTDKS